MCRETLLFQLIRLRHNSARLKSRQDKTRQVKDKSSQRQTHPKEKKRPGLIGVRRRRGQVPPASKVKGRGSKREANSWVRSLHRAGLSLNHTPSPPISACSLTTTGTTKSYRGKVVDWEYTVQYVFTSPGLALHCLALPCFALLCFAC